MLLCKKGALPRLNDEQLDILSDTIRPLYQSLEQDVIADIARRVQKTMTYTRTAELMAMEMQKLGYSPAKIRADVMKMLNADESYKKAVEQNTLEYKKAVKQLIDDIVAEASKAGNEIVANAGNMSWVDDMSVWESAGKPLTDNSYLSTLQKAIAEQTVGELVNLTKSTGFKTMSGYESIANAYRMELDKAMIKLCTGTFSQENVLNDVIHNLAHSGLRSIDYANGYSVQIDTAAKRALRTGCNQISAKIMDENIKNTGENLVYVSGHWGARDEGIGVANHELWQSRVYYIQPLEDYSEEAKRIGQESIEDIWINTGYSPDGTHENNPLGLHGYNCRHRHSVWFKGISSLPKEQPEPEPVTINGKEYDYYAMTKKMRLMERNVRALKREQIAKEALGLPTTKIKAKIKQKTREYKEFCAKCNVPTRTSNLRVDSSATDVTKTKAYNEYKQTVKNVEEIAQAKKHNKKINITDVAVEKVKLIKLSGYSEEELIKLQSKHREVLIKARNENNSNEIVSMFSTDFGESIITCGTESRVRVSKNPDARVFMMGANENSVIWIHNHPKGATFSYEDIASFMQPQIKTFSVVTNQGKIYCLNKTNSFLFKELYDRIKVLRETYKGSKNYQELIMKDILKEIEKYGVEYIR